jgi:hypothetical protein
MKNKLGMLLMEAGSMAKRSNHGGRATSDTPQCGFAPIASSECREMDLAARRTAARSPQK